MSGDTSGTFRTKKVSLNTNQHTPFRLPHLWVLANQCIPEMRPKTSIVDTCSTHAFAHRQIITENELQKALFFLPNLGRNRPGRTRVTLNRNNIGTWRYTHQPKSFSFVTPESTGDDWPLMCMPVIIGLVKKIWS